eukprot:s4054_g11.t1
MVVHRQFRSPWNFTEMWCWSSSTFVLQALVETGAVRLSSIAGSMNPADVGTKRLPAPRMRSLMPTLGMYNVQTGNLEGADDPAGSYKKKGNVVGQIAAILSVLSLHQVQGCQPGSHDDGGDASPSSLVVFTLMLGFAVLVVCRLLGLLQQQRGDGGAEPDAEPGIGRTDPVVDEPETHSHETAASSSSMPDNATHQLAFAIPASSADLPTPESMLRWLIVRCRRRLENSSLDLSRRNLYLERIAVLQGLQGALENPLFRTSVMRNMAEMADVSEDEEFPNFRGNQPVSLGDAQRAHNFSMMLRGRTSGSRHVDSIADALMRRETHGEDDNEQMETASEARRRYYESTQDQVSDPDLWAYLHYSEFTDEKQEEET